MKMSGDIWVEPFIGGGTMAINVDYDRRIVSDINSDLVNLMRWVVKSPRAMIAHCLPLFDGSYNNQDAFKRLRAKYNASKNPQERAMLFMYLNRHCYNGLMRYNKSGGYNTTFGQYKWPSLPIDDIMFFSKKMKGTRFVNAGFESLRFARHYNMTVYCDPPYLPISKTASFAAYSQEGFLREQHISLDKKARYWADKCESVWVSNNEVPLLQECYPNAANTIKFMVPRTISRNIENRKPVGEVLLQY